MAYRRTEAVENRLAETRATIVDAARRIAAEGGFGAVSMAAVAERAQVATGTLYKHFKSKDELICDVYISNGGREMALLEDISKTSQPAAARLVQAIDTFCRRAIKSRRLAFAQLGEPVSPALDAEKLKMRARHTAIYESIIKDGIIEGSFESAEPFVSASAIAGAVTATLSGPFAPDRPLSTETIDNTINALADFCLRALNKAEKPNDG